MDFYKHNQIAWGYCSYNLDYSNRRDSNTNDADSASRSDLEPTTVDSSSIGKIPSYLPENFWKNELMVTNAHCISYAQVHELP